jgi:hypothetical protein
MNKYISIEKIIFPERPPENDAPRVMPLPTPTALNPSYLMIPHLKHSLYIPSTKHNIPERPPEDDAPRVMPPP